MYINKILFSTHLSIRKRPKNNEKQQLCKLSHSKNLFLKYNKIPAKYKRKAGNRHGPAILVKLEF